MESFGNYHSFFVGNCLGCMVVMLLVESMSTRIQIVEFSSSSVDSSGDAMCNLDSGWLALEGR